MKKTLLLVPIVLASSLTVSLPAFAAKGAAYVAPAPVSDSYYHSGFYLGGAIGGDLYTAKNTQNYAAGYDQVGAAIGIPGDTLLAPEDGDYTLSQTNHESETNAAGFMGQVQLGYAYINDWFYMAGEISGNGTSGSNDLGDSTLVSANDDVLHYFNTLGSKTDVEMNSFEPVIDFKIGFKVTPNSLLYARVGAAFNDIELKETLTFTQTDTESLDSVSSTASFSKSESVVGLRYGLGGEHRFTQNLAVTLDYIHTDYGSVDLSGYADTFSLTDVDPLVEGLYVSDDVDVKRNVVMLGMNYYF